MADKDNPQNSLEDDSLEGQGSVVEGGAEVVTPSSAGAGDEKPGKAKKPRGDGSFIGWVTTHLNVYFLIFLLLVVVAGAGVLVTYQQSKKNTESEVQLQNLTDADLEAIKNSATKVGDPKSILNVESNAIFSGKVLVRDTLDVAGTIRVGGALSLPGITVSGQSSFDSVQINNLSISGNTQILGQLSIQKTLSVSGGATFGGTITAPKLDIQNLQINGNLTLSRHIDAGGATPGVTFGGALGAGGTASVSGTDTAGTVTINTGGSSPAGCFATISFANAFSSTPHVVITPNDADGAAIDYYVTRTTSSFAVCSTSNPPDNVSFGFDYISID